MPLKSQIESPSTGEVARVSQGALHVLNHPSPPNDMGNTLELIPYRAFFTTSAGSSDLIVDGSSTPVEFSIRANATQNRDRYIKTISILLSDAGLEAGLFGALATLTNGLDFEFFDPAVGVVTIDGAIKRNVDFIRLGLGEPAVAGLSGEEYIVGQVSAAPTKAEAYIPVIDLAATFGLEKGVRLPAGSEARLTFRVNDALAGLVEFNIIGYGIEHIL
jgi:hypothetical protein